MKRLLNNRVAISQIIVVLEQKFTSSSSMRICCCQNFLFVDERAIGDTFSWNMPFWGIFYFSSILRVANNWSSSTRFPFLNLPFSLALLSEPSTRSSACSSFFPTDFSYRQAAYRSCLNMLIIFQQTLVLVILILVRQLPNVFGI